ncbi:hypothetical protein GCM10008905_16060 [Clostridium malenominatum]|uniref:SigmaY antisigma factor component n=1 Tax=Clostridium malenominatum TaxID=1539 RepID=A0ABN1IY42_9CLOT
MKLDGLQLIGLIILIPILLLQGLWMFNDAKKRGEKNYWLWGIFGILNTPSNLIIYLIVTRTIIDKYAKK